MNPHTKRFIYRIGVACLAGFSLFGCGHETKTQSQVEVAEIDFLNLDPEVEYVGDEDCRLCHSKIYASFKETGMGRSFYPFTASNLVEDFSEKNHVFDENSSFHYEAVSKNRAFYQVEYRLDDHGRRVHELSRKIAYVIGSGNQARTYLTEENGFLCELPLTWYSKKKKWDMSPGFEFLNHRFSREISADCMNCHNSYAEYMPYSGNRYTGVPPGISCERCHGPGELHVETRYNTKFGDSTKTAIDKTIVNPRHLPGALQMEVCLQCHLQPQVAIPKAGKNGERFRPGMRMRDIRSVFVFGDLLPGDLRVASHGQRFASSKCYTESAGKLTCITCHNPHKSVKTMSREHFNNICITCHDHSMLSQAKPNVVHTPEADCVDCHMPQGNTSDVGHVNFTDHGIPKVPAPVQKTPPSASAKLVDFYGEQDDTAALRLGLAYLHLYDGLDHFEASFQQAMSAVAENLASHPNHEEGLYRLGMAYASTGRFNEALQLFRTLTQNAPQNALAHLQLAKVLHKMNKPNAAIESYQNALRLLPENAEALTQLGSLYVQSGRLALGLDYLNKAIAAQPSYVPAHLALGEIRVKARQSLTQARQHFLDALRLEPDSITALDNSGNLAMLANNLPEATRYFKQILAIDSKFIPVYGYLSYIYSLSGNTAEARSYLNRALQVDPENARIQAMLQQLDVAAKAQGN
jgi:predicted CXXCH cytochrome family protein